MTRYNTGNPVGSADPRDRDDNSKNLDVLVNSTTETSQPDRLGVPRKTWHGMEQDFQAAQDDKESRFQQFLLSSGYVGTGANGAVEDYSAGIEITARNQVVRADGELWRISASVTLPYITTGAGMPEGSAFVSVGDAVLRQELQENVISKRLRLSNDGDTDPSSMADFANYGGSSPARRLFVFHHYNDAEMNVLDNVGEGPNNVFFLLRNARNADRRPDKPNNFVGKADFFRLQNLYEVSPDTYQSFNVLRILYSGEMDWGHQSPANNNGVILTNSQPSNNGGYSFTLKTKFTNPRLIDIQSVDGVSAFQFRCLSGALARIDAPASMTSGLYISSAAGHVDIVASADSKLIRLEAAQYFAKTATGYAWLGKHLDSGSAPSSPTSPGERGDFYTDNINNYVYFCVAPNTWRRAAISSW